MGTEPKRPMRKLAEGKTKVIWAEESVLIESKDDITAGDGARRHVIPGKAVFATETTANCFRLLGRHGIATHFIARRKPKIFLACRCDMIPMEVVVRRQAAGSYLKRNPDEKEGTRFKDPVVEFFLKDDAQHDPLMILGAGGGHEEWFLYDARKPVAGTPIDRFFPERFRFGGKNVDGWVAHEMRKTAKRAFVALEKAWAGQDVALIDLKIEFGFDRATGALLVADVIDNDSWRIWPGGDRTKMRDKQVYRDLAEVTDADLRAIRANYAWVADATARF